MNRTLDEHYPIPLYLQLKNELSERIRGGEWKIDCQIPTEMQLCQEFGVSRITVRQALNALKEEGRLYRKRGKGTFVRHPGIEQRLSTIYSFSEQIEKQGRKSSSIVLDFVVEGCSEEIAARLQIKRGEKIRRIRRLRLVDEEPFAIETSHLPYSLCKSITSEEVEQDGLYRTLNRKHMIYPDIMEEAFEAVVIEPRFQELLKVGKNSPGLHLEHTAKCGGTIFEYCDCLIRGDRYRYTVLLKKY